MVLTVFMVGTDGDSSEWHARHVGGDSLQRHAWHAGALTHCNGMLGMSIINVIFLTNVEKWPIFGLSQLLGTSCVVFPYFLGGGG